MRRVSSRQRLVSWDAFDAAAAVAVRRDTTDRSDSDEYECEYSEQNTMHTTAVRTDTTNQNHRRKRGRGRGRPKRNHHLIISALEGLVDDVQLLICSFLDVSSLRSVLRVNHKYRALVQSAEAMTDIWMPHFAHRWPMVTAMPMPMLGAGLSLVDAHLLPTAVTAAVAGSEIVNVNVNVPLLLSMTPDQLPTEVDQSLLDPSRSRSRISSSRHFRRMITHHRMRVPQRTTGTTSSTTQLEVYRPRPANNHNHDNNDSDGSPPLIRYTGRVGSGDRCIRANHPFPRPVRKSKFTAASASAASTAGWSIQPPSFLKAQQSPHSSSRTDALHNNNNNNNSLFDLLCQGARAVSRRGAIMTIADDWRPFVSPHWRTDGALDVTPLFVAYYEVDIMKLPTQALTSTDDNDDVDSVTTILGPQTTGRTATTNASECVAVGIATESFHVHTRMPGWDSLSFGYHGDDGGIFHSSGAMVQQFGPTFGAGDTVGCGIDYVAQGIFFTLNGKFMGYGWKNVGMELLIHNQWYPVVGIDTNAPISLNMGTDRPFKYDLKEFHQSHASLIANQYQFSSSSAAASSSSGSKQRQGNYSTTTTTTTSSSSSSLTSRLSRRVNSKR